MAHEALYGEGSEGSVQGEDADADSKPKSDSSETRIEARASDPSTEGLYIPSDLIALIEEQVLVRGYEQTADWEPSDLAGRRALRAEFEHSGMGQDGGQISPAMRQEVFAIGSGSNLLCVRLSGPVETWDQDRAIRRQIWSSFEILE